MALKMGLVWVQELGLRLDYELVPVLDVKWDLELVKGWEPLLVQKLEM